MHLRRHPIRGTDDSASLIRLGLQYACYSEVTKLESTILRDQHIRRWVTRPESAFCLLLRCGANFGSRLRLALPRTHLSHLYELCPLHGPLSELLQVPEQLV